MCTILIAYRKSDFFFSLYNLCIHFLITDNTYIKSCRRICFCKRIIRTSADDSRTIFFFFFLLFFSAFHFNIFYIYTLRTIILQPTRGWRKNGNERERENSRELYNRRKAIYRIKRAYIYIYLYTYQVYTCYPVMYTLIHR